MLSVSGQKSMMREDIEKKKVGGVVMFGRNDVIHAGLSLNVR